MVNKFFEVVKVVLIVVVIFGILFYCAYSDTHYTRDGFIKCTNTPHLYTFTDTNGHVWEFTDDEIMIPCNVSVNGTAEMFTNNTTDFIQDDMILEIKIDSLSKNKKQK